jgi:signal transduction histidine kinase
MKIGTRLTVYFTLLVMGLITLISVAIYTSLYSSNESRFYERLNDKAVTKAVLFFEVENIDSFLLRTIDQARNDVMYHEKIAIYNSDGRQIYTNNDTLGLHVSAALFKRIKEQKQIYYTDGPYKVSAIYYHVHSNNNAIVIAEAIDKYGEIMLAQIRLIMLVTLMAAVIVTAVMGWFFVRSALQPISSIIMRVKSLSPVKNSERLPLITEKDEIASLIITFNELFDRLEDAFKLEKSFVANVSHELRNPLAKIKAQIEVALTQNRSNEFYRENLFSIHEDVNELNDLINNLLALSKVSSEQFAAKALLRIDEVIFEAREIIVQHYPGYVVNVNFKNPPENEKHLIINGNKYLLVTAIKNLIENACKFSPDNTAYLELFVAADSISLSVSDKGLGIPPEDIDNIFNLFYRSASIESVKGYGIGLALAKKIMDVHKAVIKLESQVGEGTTFTIYLPR